MVYKINKINIIQKDIWDSLYIEVHIQKSSLDSMEKSYSIFY